MMSKGDCADTLGGALAPRRMDSLVPHPLFGVLPRVMM
jgi:hypothetical protein